MSKNKKPYSKRQKKKKGVIQNIQEQIGEQLGKVNNALSKAQDDVGGIGWD